ncbi:PREDICTED: uncharacterized protein LOC105361186 [Ceratosolen solmsi marchali]|uniref:Uncharacterized protein LOC105361186 n=1 Tax=Ceratosolen solmsi marchali TaxID=326594 RepID=A0AAJ6YEJ8_9HYME|nr:PREDICTED: uncharacterized protein LOC105361186 [Ceratosolen solmsi marchali]
MSKSEQKERCTQLTLKSYFKNTEKKQFTPHNSNNVVIICESDDDDDDDDNNFNTKSIIPRACEHVDLTGPQPTVVVSRNVIDPPAPDSLISVVRYDNIFDM